jgi:hypothetical protein
MTPGLTRWWRKKLRHYMGCGIGAIGGVRVVWMPRGGIINRVGGVKMVAKGEVGRAAFTPGVTLFPSTENNVNNEDVHNCTSSFYEVALSY